MVLHLTAVLHLVFLAPQAISAIPRTSGREDSAGNESANEAQPLLPAAHPDVDTGDPALLKPSQSAFLFFAEWSDVPGDQRVRQRSYDASLNTSVASLSVNQTAYPSVNLVQTEAVSGLTCNNRSVTVPFDNDAAFKIAASIWPFSSAFVLIAFDEEDCGPGPSRDEHSYLLVQACRAAETGRTLTCSVTYIPFEVFVGQESIITVDLGAYDPNGAIQGPSNSSDLSTRSPARWSKSKAFTFSQLLSSNDATIYRDSYKLFNDKNFQLYCADCKASGSINIAGTVSFSIKNGLDAAMVRLSGDTHGGLRIAMDAKAWSPKITIPDMSVVSKRLSGFKIPGILELNPSLSLEVGASARIGSKGYTLPSEGGTKGYLIAGMYSLDWPDLDVTVDLVDRRSSRASGLVPDVKPSLFAPVSFQTDVTAHLAVRLGVGVKIPKRKLDRSFALVEDRTLTIEVRDMVDGCDDGAVTGRITDRFFIDFTGYEQVTLSTWGSHDYQICSSKE